MGTRLDTGGASPSSRVSRQADTKEEPCQGGSLAGRTRVMEPCRARWGAVMDDRETSPAGGGPSRRLRAKPTKEAKPPPGKVSRLQLHLPELVVKRLGVHCALAGTSWSAEVSRILLQYLAVHGRGRELFGAMAAEELGPTQQ